MNVAKGRKRGSRRGQKQNWLKFSTVSSRVAGCQQRNSDWGGVKVIIPSRCPGCERIVSGCWRRTVHVVLPSDGEHISQLHATQLRVDGCGNSGQTQPSEERHSLGSGEGDYVGLRRTISTRHPWLKKAPHCFQVCLIRVDIPGKGSSPRACAEQAGQKHKDREAYRDPIHHRPAPETAL